MYIPIILYIYCIPQKETPKVLSDSRFLLGWAQFFASARSRVATPRAERRPLPRQVAKLKDAIPGVVQKTAALPDAA